MRAVTLALLALPLAARAEPPARMAVLSAACSAATDEARRDEAFARVLTVEAGAATVGLEGEGRVVFAFQPRVQGEGEQVTLDGGEERALVQVKPELAGQILRAREQGRLTARVAFRLREADGSNGIDQPCTAVGGGRFLRVRAAPLWVDLVVGKATLARAVTPRGAAEAGAPLRVELGTIGGGGGDELVEAVQPLKPRALACARGRALSSGTIALGLAVGAGGSVDEARVVLDGLHDDPLRACLLDAARALHFPRSHHGARLTVPIAYLSE